MGLLSRRRKVGTSKRLGQKVLQKKQFPPTILVSASLLLKRDRLRDLTENVPFIKANAWYKVMHQGRNIGSVAISKKGPPYEVTTFSRFRTKGGRVGDKLRERVGTSQTLLGAFQMAQSRAQELRRIDLRL